MAKPGSEGATGAATWIWAIAALILVVLFLVWLGVTSEPSAVVVPAPDTTVAATAVTGEPVAADSLAAKAPQLVGHQVEVDLTVGRRMGEELVWMHLPGGARYMVKADAITASLLPDSGAMVVVVGRVREKTDSTLMVWQESGVLAESDAAAVREGGSTYIEAVAIRPAAPPATADTAGMS